MDNNYDRFDNYNNSDYTETYQYESPEYNDYYEQDENLPPKKKAADKKLLIIIPAVIAAAAVIAAVLFFVLKNPASKISDMLKDGDCSGAYELYEDKYGSGKTDEKLNDALISCLINTENRFLNNEINYDEAKEITDTIIDMNIKDISEDTEKTLSYIESLNGTKIAIKDSKDAFKAKDYAAVIKEFGNIAYTNDPEYEDIKKNYEASKSEFRIETLEKSKEAADKGNYDTAAKIIKDALEIVPDDKMLQDKYSEYSGKTGNAGKEDLPESEKLPASDTPVIASASTLAGQVLPASNANVNRSFEARKAVDGYYDSCWCVSMSDYSAAGAQIKIDLTNYSTVRGVKIINGNLYSPEDSIYLKNGQVQKFTLSFSDGTSKSFTAPYNSAASSDYIYFDFPSAVDTDYIILTVDSYYPGNKYTSNVCLGEIGVY